MINNAENRELELKMLANMDLDVFLERIDGKWTRWKRDDYYKGFDFYMANQLHEVVRYRTDQKDWKELTVKKRISKDEGLKTVDRLEVEVFIRPDEPDSKTLNLLEAMGFKKDVVVFKEAVVLHVEMDKETGIHGVISWYKVHEADWDGIVSDGLSMTLLEIEVDKQFSLHPKALDVLFQVKVQLQSILGYLPIVDRGVYELFSGKQYKTV